MAVEQDETGHAVVGEVDPKAATRQAWARGDYHRFAKATIWGLGGELVEACAIGPGLRVLDVACGTGNVAIPAAEAGAEVVASDLTPELFAAGRGEAADRGVALEWVEADAEALPFADEEFNVVTSSFGAIFAPNHQRVADELVRVCRPEGTIGLLVFTPEGLFAEFLEALAPYAPPPPADALSPALWGSEDHVRALFGERVSRLDLVPGRYVERAASPADYVDLFKQTFGPVVAICDDLADQPERLAAFDRDFLAFAERANAGGPDGTAAYWYDYLLVRARKRAA